VPPEASGVLGPSNALPDQRRHSFPGVLARPELVGVPADLARVAADLHALLR
jgi:hypothetical protein